MSRNQRLLTTACLVLFWLSCLFVPWELTEGTSHSPTVKHAPIFCPPTDGTWAKRQPHSALFCGWGVLAVSYAGLYAMMRKSRKDD